MRQHLKYGRLAALIVLTTCVFAPSLAWRARQAGREKSDSTAGAKDAYKHTNKLMGATSPYLLEHAHNPVDWYPWGAEALDKAKRENKLIFLSIGYSACHWCHVMAREDFENEEIAKILNANFVCIKVDREQRPDLDAQYMMAVQMMTGSGGWPMSVFLLPDRKPFFGGTYFPPAEFTSLLGKIIEVNKTQPDKVREVADKIANAIAASSSRGANGGKSGGKLPDDVMQRAVAELARRYDAKEGGFGGRVKFPEAPNLAFLLARYHKSGDKTALNMVTTTLDHIADGGVYDQIGGGFHRYSTDAIWRVPHFEKMLYDQAQLAPVYLDAWQITRKTRYRQVVEETLAFVRREMRDPAGGFTSTLDADSEGEEGKFYLWTPEQVKAALGDASGLFAEAYGVTPTGDLDGKSVLHLAGDVPDMAQQRHLKPEEVTRQLTTLRQQLLAARGKRVRPHTDDKALASWNGLMIGAFAQAYRVLGTAEYRQTAVDAANFVLQKMTVDGKLRHSYRAGKADVTGMLEDYAFVTNGLLDLYAATQDKAWLDRAQELAGQMTAQFGDTANGGFYATTEQGELLARLKDAEDNATPSGNGIAAQALARLAVLTGKTEWRAQAEKTVQAFQAVEVRAPSAFPTLLTAYQTLGATAPLAAAPGVVQLQAAPITAIPGGKAIVTLRVKIPTGWHINAHGVTGEKKGENLIATTLRLADTPDAKLINVSYPDGQVLKAAFAAETLSVYEGEITVRTTLQITANAQPGRHRLKFVFAYQPCNDRACLAPTQAQIDVLLEIKP